MFRVNNTQHRFPTNTHKYNEIQPTDGIANLTLDSVQMKSLIIGELAHGNLRTMHAGNFRFAWWPYHSADKIQRRASLLAKTKTTARIAPASNFDFNQNFMYITRNAPTIGLMCVCKQYTKTAIERASVNVRRRACVRVGLVR